MIERIECNYKGEFDEEGHACGLGVATRSDGDKYEGTFFNDLPEGICK